MRIKDNLVMKDKTPKGHRSLAFALAVFMMGVLWTSQAFAGGGNNGGQFGGGSSGPGPALATVAQVKDMSDDTMVALRGNIIQTLGGKHYVFKDSTGTINVEIGAKRWQGQNIGPDDLVDIYGEVDKDWSNVEIEVKQIIKR